jgi:hypothetical protein
MPRLRDFHLRAGVVPGGTSGLSAKNWKSAAVRNKFSFCTRTQESYDPPKHRDHHQVVSFSSGTPLPTTSRTQAENN